MNTKDYVASLFRDYEETAPLKDFMEELRGNLDARIASLTKKGISETEAFAKASAELGDLSALADELSLKRRQEIFAGAFMGLRHYMKPARAAAYVACGAALAFGVITALIVFLAPGRYGNERFGDVFGVLLAFGAAAAAGFTFLGMTQESSARYPLSAKRALWYTVAAAAVTFGLILFPITFFTVGLMQAVAALIPFALPGGGLLAFLLLTEKDRAKPWAKAPGRK